jgi:hypothetical protein
VGGTSGRRDGAVLLALVVAVCVFLWEPITGGGIFAPGDMVQRVPLFRVAPRDYTVANSELVDPAAQYLPWLAWNRHELWAGRLPLWNPYNGSGVPHLANGQSAVFSVFSLPHYVLPLRWAPVVAAFVQLVTGGVLAYGLLRHLGRSRLAGLVGGFAFAFGGTSVLWLQWPLSDAACLVPGMVWAASTLVTATDARARCRAAAATAGSVGLGLLAGHPETTFFGVLLAGGFGTARALTRAPRGRPALPRLACLAGAGGLGAGLAAVTVLPLVEYVGYSAAADFRGGQIVERSDMVALHLFPLVLGSPAQRFSGEAYRWPPFIESADLYVGGTALLLASVGVVGALRSRARVPLFFVAAGAASAIYSYDVGGTASWLGRLPVLDLVMTARSAVVWQTTVTVLAGFGVDALRASGRGCRRRLVSLALVGWWAAVTGAGVWLARHLRDAEAPSDPADPALRGLAAVTAGDHIRYVVATLAVGLGGALLPVLARRRVASAAGGLLLAVSTFLQGCYMFRDFNPTVDERYVYSETAASTRVAAITGGEQTLWLDDAALLPDANLWYRLRSPGSYDALGVRSYDALYRRVLRSPQPVIEGFPLGVLGGPVRPRGLGSLRALGIRYVVTGERYPFLRPSGGSTPRSSRVPGLKLVSAVGGHRVFAVAGAPPRYFSPATVTVTDREDAWRRTTDPTFDPIRSSVVEGQSRDRADRPDRRESDDRTGQAGQVDVLDESPTKVRLRVRRDGPGWLIALQTRYPGWRARVDGSPARISTANTTFLAVPVPAGESVIELTYAPASFRTGAAVSALAAATTTGLLSIGYVGYVGRPPPRRARRLSPTRFRRPCGWRR